MRYAGISKSYPAGVLKAGEENRVPVFFTIKGSYQLSFATINQNDSEHTTFGSWAEYGEKMSAAATRLNARGKEEYRGSVIYDLALAVKNGIPCTAISGVARNVLTGEVLAGYEVQASSAYGDMATYVTDDNGYFQLTGLHGGIDYSLNGEVGTSSSVTVQTNGDVNNVCFEASTWSQVQGWIYAEDSGLPLEGVKLSFISSACQGEGITDEDGAYSIKSLAPGNYQILVESVNGYCGVYEESCNLLSSQCLQKNYVLTKGSIVSGSLVDEKGNPVGDTKVRLASMDTAIAYDCSTDSEGQWRIEGVPTGTYKAMLIDGDWLFVGEEPLLEVDGTGELKAEKWHVKQAAAFYALGSKGPVPLTATFGIREVYGAVNEATIAWDFDGDGKTDSTDVHPIHVYDSVGNYTVTVSFEDQERGKVVSTWEQCVTAYEKVETKVNANVMVVGEAGGYSIVSYKDDQLVMSRKPGTTKIIKEGSFLVCQEYGFALRVLSVSESGTTVTAKVTNAAISELFDQIDMVCVSNEAVSAGELTRATGTITIGKPMTGSTSFKLCGIDYTLTASMALQTEFSLRKLNDKWKMSFALALPMKMLLHTQVGASGGSSGNNKILLFEINRPWVVMVGVVPVVLNFRIPVALDLSAALKYQATISTDGMLQLTPRNGFELYDGHFAPISGWNPSASWEANKIAFDSSLSVKCGLEVGAVVDIYAINHVGVYFTPFVNYVLSIVPNPEFRVEVGVNGRIEASVMELNVGIRYHDGRTALVEIPLKWSMPLPTYKKTIRRWRLPKTDFSYSPGNGIKVGNAVRFEDKSAASEDAISATAWNWDFGDGSTSTEQFPIHSFAKEGKYTVSLTISCGKFSFKKPCKKTVAVGKPDDDDEPPVTEPEDEEDDSSKQSNDPNEIAGVIGFGDKSTQRYVMPGEWLDYTVYFENKSTAAVPAQEVTVTQSLSKWLDWSSLELGEIAFNNQIQMELKGKRRGTAMVAQSGTQYHVRMTASTDEETGVFKLYLRSYDKSRQAYGYWPEPVDAGFLPPNDDSHCGEGHFTFRVKVREDAPDGAFVNAEASVVFDQNAAIVTSPAWFNWVTTDAKAAADGKTLRWDTSEDPDGTTYQVTAWSGDPDFNAEGVKVAATSSTLTSGSWSKPTDLAEGDYYWHVVKTLPGGTTETSSTWGFTVVLKPTLEKISITGLDMLANGESALYVCIASYSDNSEAEVTPEWRLSGTEYASLADGKVTNGNQTQADQTVTLAAKYEGKEATKEITLLGDYPTWALELKSGWNWVSFPVLLPDRKVGNVLGSSGFSVNDLIQTAKGNARFSGSSWIPSSFSVDYGKLYKVYVAKDVKITLVGEGSGTSSLVVTAGWNWIGNPTEKAVTPAELKHSAGFSAGDRILGSASSVTYNGSKWIPSSGFSLEPGKGYQLYTAKAGTLKFAEDEKDTYLVVDLSGGTTATSYPWRYTDEAPDVTKDECRTTELWLRRIPAGTFTMGSPTDELGRSSNETQHQVTLTEDFYIGVFECTQKQWELVMGTTPSCYKGDTRPVEQVSYDMIRGRGSTAGAGWPEYGHKVDADSFMGKIQQKTGLVFDLPSEAQWEYACRKREDGSCWGTALNSGKNLTSSSSCANMAEVGRYTYNRSDGKGGYSQHTKVGSYQPSELGLYDMHGNVWEWNLDRYASYGGDVENPAGAATGSNRVLRGGGWNFFAQVCRAANRNNRYPLYRDYYYGLGFRLVFLPSSSLAD